VRRKQSGLEDRINNAMHQHNLLEQRLHCLKNLPGAHKKPLSKAEREFKSELGNQFYARSNYFNKTMQISERHFLFWPIHYRFMCRTLISFLWSYPFLLPLSHNSTCSILKSIHFCLLVVVTSVAITLQTFLYCLIILQTILQELDWMLCVLPLIP